MSLKKYKAGSLHWHCIEFYNNWFIAVEYWQMLTKSDDGKISPHTRAVQKVSDLNSFRLNKSSTGSVLHCECGGDIYAHAWISSRLQIASVAGSWSMIVYVLWALGGLSIIAKWWNELSSVIALNFAKSLAILKLKLFERFNRLSGTMPWVSHE